MTDSRYSQSSPTRRSYKKRKKGMSAGGKIIVWTVVFLLCFFVPFFTIYFGNTNKELSAPTEVTETAEKITPEARIYQLEQENEQLRIQIRDLEAKLDALSIQNASLQNNMGEADHLSASMIGDRPADNNGWEELPPEEEEEPIAEQLEQTQPAPAEVETESDPSLFGNNGL